MVSLPGKSWIEFANEEARQLQQLAGEAERSEQRRALAEALETEFRFPLKVAFRGYVVRQRIVKKLKVRAGGGATETSTEPYLEVVPERFGKEAYDLLGGVLVPARRSLQPGSVVELEVELQTLSKYRLNPPGIMSRLRSCDVVVGVEA